MPTDAYELETAVADGYLVPPRVRQVDLKFPRESHEKSPGKLWWTWSPPSPL